MSAIDDEEGQVLDLETFIRRKRGKLCLHRAFLISDDTATLICRACEAPLDPWWVLRKIAHRAEQWVFAREAAKQDTKRLQAEVDALKAEKHRLQGQVRRLKIKAVE